MNHGAMMALMAAAPIATQPAPLKNAATNNCHGSAATAQPQIPTESDSTPALVTAGSP
jgi:hypothetical protein